MDASIDYYNSNADAFRARTVHCDMSETYQKFIPLLPNKANILDAGCGIGRDARHFKNLGYDLVAFDASAEMIRMASENLDQPVLHLNFSDLNFDSNFDGIWASASLLHVPYAYLREVIQRLHRALKKSGIFYASFKYGDCLRTVDGRDFYDLNERLLSFYLSGLFEVVELWQTLDPQMIAPGPTKTWLKVVCRKL